MRWHISAVRLPQVSFKAGEGLMINYIAVKVVIIVFRIGPMTTRPGRRMGPHMHVVPWRLCPLQGLIWVAVMSSLA